MIFLPAILTSMLLISMASAPTSQDIKTYDIGWLMMEIPSFRNAPNFNLLAGLSGQMPIGNAGDDESSDLRKQAREKIEKFLADMIGDDDRITWTIWQKTLIVKYR